ncbi:hypothetical protein BD410DRAFT_791976 [Rickenella mellea]|uniref:Uncharacterized protein n=1 Tax=Rickenella mellea TaxID=50990 RepID=A0A4Y7PYB1_9AGAM|nr:hypothetical protein BD410DRAFT_791976 [Rickenella mellea]
MAISVVPAKIDDQALNALVLVLERVKSNGGDLEGEHIWLDADAPTGCLDVLKILKSHKETLLRLRKFLEKKIRPVQKACNELVLHSGIQSIPTEVLSEIFLISRADAENSNEHSISVSHVSRRFREVALQTAGLWTTLYANHPLLETMEFLKRTGSAPLHIDLTCDFVLDQDHPLAAHMVPFLEVVVPHSSRWKVLDINFVEEDTNDFPNFGPNLQVPLLSTLTHNVEASLDENTPLNCIVFPYSTPNLRLYKAVNVMPTTNAARSTLTSCCLRWNGHPEINDMNIDLSLLLSTLDGMPSLNDLTLAFYDVFFLPSSIPASKSARFPSIKKFSLEYGPGRYIDALVFHLMRSFDLPSVIDFTITYSTNAGFVSPIQWEMPKGPIPVQTLQKLCIRDATQIHNLSEVSLDRCESLQHFTLDSLGVELFWEGCSRTRDRVWSKQIPLRTLTLRHCDKVKASEVEFLTQKLRHGSNWNTFERLEISCCKKLDEEFLLSIEDDMDGRLAWTI